jgi:hypothetical protein
MGYPRMINQRVKYLMVFRWFRLGRSFNANAVS